MYRIPLFSRHLIDVSFSSVISTYIQGDVLTSRLVRAYVSVLRLGVK